MALVKSYKEILPPQLLLNPDFKGGCKFDAKNVQLSCQACQEPTDKTSLDERGYIPLSSVQSLYVVELKLSLCTRLARQTHARRMPNP
jgi:hypothetical protein